MEARTQVFNGGDCSWIAYAACRDHDNPEWWFPDKGKFTKAGGGPGEAVRICLEECCVRKECLEYALAGNIQHGIWGGVSERQRRRLRRKRKAA